MKRIVNNSKQYTSSVFRYAGTPHPVSSKYKTLQRIGLFRNIGILLGLCKDYVGLDTEILKKAGMGIVSTASEKKVADAIKKYKKSEPAKVKNNQKKYKTQLTEAESLSRLKQALSMFLHAAQVIEKKGGKIVFDEQQLLHYLRLGRNEFPNDSLLSSLAKKLSLGREGSSNIPDATDAFQKIKESGKLPTPTSTAFKIFRLANNDNTNISDLTAAVETDPAIAARILKFANSAFYKSLHPVTSIQDAIIRLGIKMIKRISLGSSLISANKIGPCVEFDYELFWSESLARAVIARNITDVKDCVCNREEAYTVGLLCQIGRLALATVYPEKYAVVLKEVNDDNPLLLNHKERQNFGLDHNELAAEMMADWHLPDIFCKAVRFQDSITDRKNLPPGSPEFELASLLQWPAKMSMILTQSGIKRESLKLVIDEASQMGLAGPDFAQRFDSISNEWRELGDIMEVKTRKVLPWNEILSQIN